MTLRRRLLDLAPVALVLLVSLAPGCRVESKGNLPADRGGAAETEPRVVEPRDAANVADATPSANLGEESAATSHPTVVLPEYQDGTVDYDEAARVLQEELARDEDPLAQRPPETGVRRIVGSDKPLSRIRELTAEELPTRTRTQPDPVVDQFERDAVYVRITETLTKSDGTAQAAENAVVESYMKEYFRRAGHPVVGVPEKAVYRVEGTIESRFDAVLTFKEEIVATAVEGAGRIEVLDADGEIGEAFEVPVTRTENSLGEEAAFVDLSRYLAKLIWDRLSREGKFFGQADVQLLLEALAEGNILEIENLTAEFIVAKLADYRFEAVPFLIEALTDTRTVQLHSTYPGLDRFGAEALKVYHMADKALEEIFQKISRMNLLTPPRHRFVMVRGWENEWRRFCRPFRESSSRRVLDGES